MSTRSQSNIYFAVMHGNPHSFILSWLTKLFTGSTAFHAGFVDLGTYTLTDMHNKIRVAEWPLYNPPKYEVHLYPAHMVTREGLSKLCEIHKDEKYGNVDYIGFGFRWFYKLINHAIPDFSGTICSEMVAEWANDFGYKFPTRPVLSPGELEEYLVNKLKLERYIP